jgi:hypothetical protein
LLLATGPSRVSRELTDGLAPASPAFRRSWRLAPIVILSSKTAVSCRGFALVSGEVGGGRVVRHTHLDAFAPGAFLKREVKVRKT